MSQANEYPKYIEEAIAALLDRGIEAGARELQPIAYAPREIVRLPAPSRLVRAQILRRDSFQCRYCDRKTVFEWVMTLLAGVYPDLFPWHMNWKTGATHPAVSLWSAMVDHVVPASHGGSNEIENLVTACNPCNLAKASFDLDDIGWQLKPIASNDWDGLLQYYVPLWERVGRPRPTVHQAWFRAFGLQSTGL